MRSSTFFITKRILLLISGKDKNYFKKLILLDQFAFDFYKTFHSRLSLGKVIDILFYVGDSGFRTFTSHFIVLGM